MKFNFEYRSSDNVLQRGTIAAPTRDAAYAALRARGIRPSRVTDAPGFFNKLLGKGKRWIAIVILMSVSASLLFALRIAKRDVAGAALFEDRAQLYGDPVVIGECENSFWTNVFTSAFDCRLAQYAVPGKMPVLKGEFKDIRLGPGEDPTSFVSLADNDLAEIAQMKRMVNGIKRELAEYLAAGGTVGLYMKRLDIRQRAERGIVESARQQIVREKDHSVWKVKNAELRAMGLPMVELPSVESDGR